MKLSSKNPVQGFVKCEHCGKPAPVHKPKGGPRKNTFYYNCIDHKNQQGRGVHDYILAEMVPTLDEWAEKWDSQEEADELKKELERCGLSETPLHVKDSGNDEREPVFTPCEDENVVIDHESGQVIDEPKPEPKQASNSALLLFIIVCVVLVAGASFVLVKRFKESKPSPSSPTQPPSEQKPSNQLASASINSGVLL
jgi:hypothetical protein